MIIWLIMLIPIIGCSICYFLYKHKIVWWELLLPSAISFIIILGFKFTTEKILLRDTEYMGGLIVEARYYEYWSTWVSRTCTRTYACGSHTEGSGDSQRTVTDYCEETYDCSYCDENSAYWKVYDNQGNSWTVSEDKYNQLLKQWSATPKFVDLHRDIDRVFGCGKDGDMYSISWNGKVETSEASTWEASYENHVQVSKKNFNLKDISDEDAKKYNLYDYPKVNHYEQINLLGLDSLKFLDNKKEVKKLFEYFNGKYGPERKMRLFVLFFNNQNIDIAVKQKNYWDGGNKNEIVICIDLDKNNGKINWVYPITWTENKRIAVDLREDIMGIDTMDFKKLYDIVEVSSRDFKYRDFNQFNYLPIDQPKWVITLTFVIVLLVTIGTLYYGINNNFDNN